ncbi:16S rRNA (uracil(1498)-N(3))-methyltransferase [Solemya pervernicosa gill symbiont]|uniref:Ribosomal RNA small subunit methyltransferase E n=2 Tax=Gammaproteobacteria incertae sedis TaxID=118884 RepID=A0A1T2L9Y4_9GAMM|nr:16S rRNA (uracil(1498)-N(3))-methyltransferase [Candidatus Reidiella endopervernicosa]OOZ41917.1 16S rRNA (uracil(1498)-N(3))-methyltransferase [Solemya pervernicosa gill symbiont]QKQ24879.1 16S rRNA (uracil(1498)-N(3))-methyltransferase [Candidatus Reidiella endopervernicosa]
MRVPRIFHPGTLQCGTQVALASNAANHVGRVLRIKPGAPLILFNGEGGEYRAKLTAVTRNNVTVEIEQFIDCDRESPLKITLAQGVSRGERMDFALQKAVELGVDVIVPVVTERTTVQLKGERQEKKLSHWRGVITGACEQSGRSQLPQLESITPIDRLFQKTIKGAALVLDPEAKHSLSTLEPQQQITLLIGPEGGLSDREIAAANSAGYQSITMGPRVLRTETAALAAVTALQTLWGDLG